MRGIHTYAVLERKPPKKMAITFNAVIPAKAWTPATLRPVLRH